MTELLDLHVYTNNSPAGNDKIAFLCEKGVEKGLRGAAFTDLCPLDQPETPDLRRRLRHAYFDACKGKQVFFGSFSVFAGIELELACLRPEAAERILSRQRYDIVLSSVSRPAEGGFGLSPDLPPEAFFDFCARYAAMLCDTVKNTDFDVLSRPLAPLRGLRTDFSVFEEAMQTPLRMLAESGRALEIDARDLTGSERVRDLYLRLIEAFRSFGGAYVTLGSESSFYDEVGAGIELAADALRRAGFQQTFFYDQRIPYGLDL